MAQRSAYNKGGGERVPKEREPRKAREPSKYGDYAAYKYYKANKEKYRKK